MKEVPFKNRIWLSSPTMHGEEEAFVGEAFLTNWVSTVGKNIDELERGVCNYLGGDLYAAALSSGTAALHLAFKLAGVKKGDRVFASNLTFAATVNPILYEGAQPVFIESEYESWNMSPEALRRAFLLYPNTKCVVVADLYGTPAKLSEIREICDENGAFLIEDAAESFGASYQGKKAGCFGDFNVISFNGNKIITTSGGGMLLSRDKEAIERAKFLSTQSREAFPWYQHETVGYNYRLSNILAGIGRGQLLHLESHVERKKEIYERYREGFKGLPLSMNPIPEEAESNYWLSCILIDEAFMATQDRSRALAGEMLSYGNGTNAFIKGVKKAEKEPILSLIEKRIGDLCEGEDFGGRLYKKEKGKTSPEEIRAVLEGLNVESRPIWKPMSLQPVFSDFAFVTKEGEKKSLNFDYIDADSDIFHRGLCLPSDIKMKNEEQDVIIRVIRALFEE